MKKWRLTTLTRYVIYLVAVHLVLGWMAYLLLKDNLLYFLPVELLLLVSFYVGFRFYRTFLAPVRLMESGESAMADRDFATKFLPVGSPEVDRLVELYNNMIDNLRAERTNQQEQHYFLDRLMATADLGIIILGYEGEMLDINDWGKERLGMVGALDLPLRMEAIDHPLAKELSQLPKDTPEVIHTGNNRRFRAEKGGFVDRGFDRNFIIFQDITSDLLAAEKEAYGKVIRMMAHEVNNSTGAMNSLLRSLHEAAEMDEAPDFAELAKDYLPVVVDRGERMNEFMRRFANVIRLPSADRTSTDLGELAERVTTLCRPQCMAAGIELKVQRPERPFYVQLDAAQIEQLLINAVTNARESIGRNGTISLVVRQRPAGITVIDNGAGIPEAAQERLFSPFFSTKPTGQGVGLTLSRDILEQHDADYRLYTDKADGLTRFEIEFKR